LDPAQSLQEGDLFLVTQSLEDANESKCISANALARELRDMASNTYDQEISAYVYKTYRLDDGTETP
jgi:hypothetical protein